jgi:hypothetical protein
MRAIQKKGKVKHECVVEHLQQRDTLGVMMIPPPLTCTVVVLKGWRSKSMEASTSKAGEGQSVRNGGSLRKVASGLLLFHSPLPFMFPSLTLQNTKFLCWKLHSSTHPGRKSSGDSPWRILDQTFLLRVNKQVVFSSQWSKLACITKSSLSLRPS